MIATLQVTRRYEPVPVRVDFAGGWLDVPDNANHFGRIVNCAVLPALQHWEKVRGVGGSGAALVQAYLERGHTRSEAGRLAALDEVRSGCGWQDSAVAAETGLCVWQPGPTPILLAKYNPAWLDGHLYLFDTGEQHDTKAIASNPRDYQQIGVASLWAERAVEHRHVPTLGFAMSLSLEVQLAEGMQDRTADIRKLVGPDEVFSWKYLGSGWGGALLVLSHRPFALRRLQQLTPFILSFT